MAFGTRPAGTTTRANPKIEYIGMAVENVARGVVVVVDDTGFITIATAALATGRTKFVTVEALDNSGGSAGDIAIGVVGPGQFVTVETVSALVAGDRVQISATDGKVNRFIPGTDNEEDLVGTFLRKEGGVIAKNATTPFTEEFTDDGDYDVGDAVANDIVEIRID